MKDTDEIAKRAGEQLEADVKGGAAARSMPKQKPGRSEQIVVTPFELLDAVEMRWGNLHFDLAATRRNMRIRELPSPKDVRDRYLGPGSRVGEDALAVKWRGILRGMADRRFWLNPPFGRIGPWAEKCYQATRKPGGPTIFLLVPASLGAGWWNDWVHEKAKVISLSPRVRFEGHLQHYPKDLAICVYGAPPGGSTSQLPWYSMWRRDKEAKPKVDAFDLVDVITNGADWKHENFDAQKMFFHKEAKKRLRAVARAMGLSAGQFDVHSSPGGSAIMGEVSLKTDALWVCVIGGMHTPRGVLYRAADKEDPYGARSENFWLPYELLNDPPRLAKKLARFASGRRHDGLDETDALHGRQGALLLRRRLRRRSLRADRLRGARRSRSTRVPRLLRESR